MADEHEKAGQGKAVSDEKECPPRYAIGFDRGKGERHGFLSIIDRDQPEGPLRVRHSSRSWEITATHLAFAFDRIEELERQLAQLEIGNMRLRVRLWRRFDTPIVCLCGSTRFIDAFDEAALQLTLRGIIVLSIGSHKPRSRDYANDVGGHKAVLDQLHKRKIDLAHSVFVLDLDHYVGKSTQSEIEYAQATGKPICYWAACDPTGDAGSWDEIAAGCRHAAKMAQEIQP